MLAVIAAAMWIDGQNVGNINLDACLADVVELRCESKRRPGPDPQPGDTCPTGYIRVPYPGGFSCVRRRER